MGLPWEGGQGVKRAPTTARTRGRWSRATLLRGTVCIQSARRKRREKQRSVSGLKHDGRATPSRLPGMNLPGRTSQETGDTGTVQTGPAPCRGRRCKEPGKTCRGAGRWGGRRLQGRGPRQSQPRASRKPRAVSCPGGPFTDDTLTRSEEPWWGRRSKPCRPREEGQRARRERVAAGRSRPEAHGWGRAWFTARPGRPHSNRCSRVLEAARTAHLQLELSSLPQESSHGNSHSCFLSWHSPFGMQDLSSPARGRTRLPCSGSRRAPPAELPGSPTHSPATSPVFSSPRGPLTMSPFLGQARPFCTNFPWFCRFFGPPSANLQSKGSDGAAEREKADRQLGPTSLSPFTHAKSLQNPHRSHSLWPQPDSQMPHLVLQGVS